MPTTVRTRRIALVAAPLATALAIGAGVAIHDAGFATSPATASASQSISGAVSSQASQTNDLAAKNRAVAASRSADRAALARLPKATGKLWTTAPLELRVFPRPNGPTQGQLKPQEQVAVTGHHSGAYAQVLIGKTARWVTADYLSKQKVQPPGSKGLVDQPCPGTSGVENGLTSGAVRVYRAVCNNFPQITQYGGYAPRGEHASGKAIDIMTSDTTLGNQIAAFLQSHAGELNLYDIIWQQHIWTPVRASEGWRSMPSRGSETANHFDHVHVSVN